MKKIFVFTAIFASMYFISCGSSKQATSAPVPAPQAQTSRNPFGETFSAPITGYTTDEEVFGAIGIAQGSSAQMGQLQFNALKNAKTLIIEKNFTGGQATETFEIENYPGFVKIGGFELMQEMEKQAISCGAEIRFDEIEQVDLTVKKIKLYADAFCVFHFALLRLVSGNPLPERICGDIPLPTCPFPYQLRYSCVACLLLWSPQSFLLQGIVPEDCTGCRSLHLLAYLSLRALYQGYPCRSIPP